MDTSQEFQNEEEEDDSTYAVYDVQLLEHDPGMRMSIAEDTLQNGLDNQNIMLSHNDLLEKCVDL